MTALRGTITPSPEHAPRTRAGRARMRAALAAAAGALILSLTAAPAVAAGGSPIGHPVAAGGSPIGHPVAAGGSPIGHPASVPLEAAEELAETDCAVAVPERYAARVTCHLLEVPRSRAPGADPAMTLRLPVAVIASTSRDPETDPLVFPTAGGPGAGSLGALGYFLEHADWALRDRDVIVMEQRGGALADPTLDCPELDTAEFIVDGELLSGGRGDARRLEQLQQCRDRLVAEGIDLAAYTSRESAADLAALRLALGYDEWNLYGLGYGSRLALTVMRDQAEGLRAVILDGVLPPEINRYEQLPAAYLASVQTLFADCASDADCSAVYPDLPARLSDLLDRTRQSPLGITVKHPVDGTPVRMALTDADLSSGLFDAFSDADLVRVLPYLIDRLADGDSEAAVPLAQRSVDAADRLSEGLHLSIDCAEEVPFHSDEAIAAARAADPLLEHLALTDGVRERCDVWAVPALSTVEAEAVASAIPTLLTSGGYDPVTPAAWAEAAAANLSTHYLHTFPGVGHGAVWSTDDCAALIAQRFLADPSVAPASSCIPARAVPDFLTSKDIHPTSAIYRFDSDVLRDRDTGSIAVAVISILIFTGTLIYAAVYALSWLHRRRGEAPGGAVLAAAASAGLNLVYVAGLALVMAGTDPLILAFGLPAGAWPLLLVPFGAIIAAILLIVLVVRAWWRRDGSLGHRIALSVTAVASIVFAIWLLSRGLLLL